MSDYWELEDGSGRWQLEDGSGLWLLESSADVVIETALQIQAFLQKTTFANLLRKIHLTNFLHKTSVDTRGKDIE